MLDKTLQSIQEHRLISNGDRVLVAVSGGADSTGLLYLLFALSRKLEIHLGVVHIHHGLRGKEADREAEFVQHLGWKLGVPVHQVRVDTRARANQDHYSVEMAARALRHEAFQGVLQTGDYSSVALAHTLDDQAETVMLRLSRGTSLQGVGGMDFDTQVKGFRIIRPLLNIDRQELRAYLHSHGVDWMEDSSNTSMSFLRNRMRHEVLPLLKNHFNPQVAKHLVKVAREARGVATFIDRLVDEAWEACVPSTAQGQGDIKLRVEAFDVLDPVLQNRLALRWLRLCGVAESGLSRQSVEALIQFMRSSGRAWNFPGNVLIEKCRGGVRRVSSEKVEGYRLDIPLPSVMHFPELGFSISIEASRGRYPVYPNRLGTFPQEAFIAQRVLKDRLLLRTWEAGDRISPLGMKGRKKVQDVFTDEKVDRADRQQIPLICSEEQVLWIPGYAVDRRAGVEDFSEPSWHITLHPATEYENAHKSQ